MTDNTEEMSESMREIYDLNPQFRWNRRKVKKIIKWRAEQLPVGTYAMGCRGHPGIVIERLYDRRWGVGDLYRADVSIKSLIDGGEESCSIFSCAPLAIDKERALDLAERMRTQHAFDIALAEGHTLDDIKEWAKDWIDRGVLHYVIYDREGYECRSSRAFTLEEAHEEVERLSGDYLVSRGYTNPRIVDMLSYPAPPTIEYQ